MKFLANDRTKLGCSGRGKVKKYYKSDQTNFADKKLMTRKIEFIPT